MVQFVLLTVGYGYGHWLIGGNDMTDIILETLGLYLDGDIDLDTLEDRIIPLLWSAQLEKNETLLPR